ncbi:MAG: CsgG/HfaB family protein [Bryobacteraceae bacterium]
MPHVYIRTFFLVAGASVAHAQAPPPKPAIPRPAKPAVPTVSAFDQILQLVKLKMPEAAILKKIGDFKTLNPTVDQLIQLKTAGASDAVILAVSGQSASAPAAAAAVPAKTIAPVVARAASTGFPSSLEGVKCEAPAQARKRVVAVEEFDFTSVMTSIQAVFGTHVNIGAGIRAMFTKRMHQDGKFRIVERAKVNKLIAEQDFGASNRVKKGTQARIGQIIGSDAILMGDIIIFGRDDKGKSVGGFGIGGRMLGSLKVGSKEEKAVVAINFRLVDAESSEVIATGEARGESSRKSKGFAIAGYGSRAAGAGAADMTSSNFAETIIGEATMEAVTQLAKQLSEQDSKIQARNVEVETRVAEVNPPQLYLSAGSTEGVQKCDRFEISRVVREVKDPQTKEVIDLVTEPVGELVVTDVRDRVAIGTFAGGSAPQAGYVARKK